MRMYASVCTLGEYNDLILRARTLQLHSTCKIIILPNVKYFIINNNNIIRPLNYLIFHHRCIICVQ